LTRYTGARDVLERLTAVSPEDLRPYEVRYAPDKEPSLTAALTIAIYQLEVDGREIEATAVQGGLDKVLRRGELEVVQKGKTKVYDLARSVPKDVRAQSRDGGVAIELPVRMGPQGSLRPEALIRAALAETGLVASAVRTTRLDLLVEDSEGVWSRPV